MVTVSNFLSSFSLSELKKLLLTLFFVFYYFYEDIDMNTFEQLITTLATFSLVSNNWDEKCHALKVLLENTQMNGYVRHRKDTDCLVDTLYIWENADPNNDLQVLIKSRDSVTWDVKIILNNQIVSVIGLRSL